MTDTMGILIGRRYEILEMLGEGGMGVVYRVYDRLSGAMLALKHVTLLEKRGLTNSAHDLRLALAREFRTLASLRHPHIISVLDYGFDQTAPGAPRHPYFVMELLDRPRTIVEAGRGQSFQKQLLLLTQALQALIYLHRRGIIHRDLKPDNMLVVRDAEGQLQVKLLDFGLAIARDTLIRPEEEAVGTLAYMAPELLQGGMASTQSDLYALGMIAYEIFSGSYPFELDNITRLLRAIVEQPPDISRMDVEPTVASIVGRLLMKSADDRYPEAHWVLKDLLSVSRQKDDTETPLIRDSLLQAARFVGRETELATLTNALTVLTDHSGTAWLVGGESGVGKSRLLSELRTHALVNGIVVLRGQSNREGEMPYQLWRDVMCWLCLQVDVLPDEAAVLAPFVPDLPRWVGFEIPPAPNLDPQTQQDRLITVIEGLLSRQTAPLLVILEDIHWARSDNLAVLNRLSREVARMPLMLVAAFRDDEAAHLPTLLPQMQLMKLERLDTQSISELSESMLGEAGRRADVLRLIERESEGNAFFMIEVARALAEEAGQVEQIGTRTLPSRLFLRDMRALLERRLARVSAAGRELLALVAVAGREINLALLRQMLSAEHTAPALEKVLEEWLQTCSDAAVLEVQDDVWRFSHDKLRESLLDGLDEAQRRALHQRVAQALEAIYPDNAGYLAALAYHWGMAGDLWRELLYTGQAGEQALRGSANREAAAYFRRALAILDQLGPLPGIEPQKLRLQMGLMTPLMTLQGYAAAEIEEVAQAALALAEQLNDQNQTVRVLSTLAGYYVSRAEHTTAFEVAWRVLNLAQQVDMGSGLLSGHIISGQALFFMGRFREANGHMDRVAELYDPAKRKSRPTYGQDFGVTGLIFQGVIAWMLGRLDTAADFARRALALAETLDHPFSLAFALNWSGAIAMYLGDFASAFDLLNRCNALSQRKGFALFDATSLANLTWARAQLEPVTDDLYDQLVRGVWQYQATGARFCLTFYQYALADLDLQLGRYNAALAHLEEGLALVETYQERWQEPEILRLRGAVYWQMGDTASAEQDFERALAIARRMESPSFELRAVSSLARLLADQGRGAEARERLERAYHRFAEGRHTPDLLAAHDLLMRL